MRLFDLRGAPADSIHAYGTVGTSGVVLADGAGEAHVYTLRFEPGGAIGRHEAGFGQLFLVVEGRGWVEGGDGQRVARSAGQGCFFARGEMHSKGSETGMTAVMVQVRDLDPTPAASDPSPGGGT